MTSVKVLLNSFERIRSFVNITSRFEADMEVVYGRTVIDAKSIVGIFSVELSQPVKLCIYADGEEAEKIHGHLSGYLV